jgi:hypothetical protein
VYLNTLEKINLYFLDSSTVFLHIRPAGIIFSGPFIQRSKYITPKVILHKCAGLI